MRFKNSALPHYAVLKCASCLIRCVSLQTGRDYVLSRSSRTPRIASMQKRMDARSCTGLILATSLSLICFQTLGAIPSASDIQPPAIGDHALHILSPNLLELFLVNTKQADPARVNMWDWVDGEQNFI